MPANHNDRIVYKACMEKVRERLGIVQAIAARQLTTGSGVLDTELTCVQLRKVLELIAYSSLAANREKYAEANPGFEFDGRAKKILERVRKVNPAFFPVPMALPVRQPDGAKHCEAIADGFLTEDEFVTLFDGTSEILHMQNPFSSKIFSLPTTYDVGGWVSRIQRLLACHRVHLVNGELILAVIPSSGPVEVFQAAPTP